MDTIAENRSSGKPSGSTNHSEQIDSSAIAIAVAPDTLIYNGQRLLITNVTERLMRLSAKLAATEARGKKSGVRPQVSTCGGAEESAHKPKRASQQQNIDPKAVKIPQAAALMGVCKRTVEYLIERGELPSVGIGRARRILVADIDAFLEAHRI